MFKNKLFLYGLGTGLIIASILIQMTNFAISSRESDAESNQEYDLDVLFSGNIAELNDAAEANGYRIVRNKDAYYSQEQIDQIRQEAREEAISENKETATQTNVENLGVSSFTITPGMGTAGVSRQLLELKLIQDASTFLEALENASSSIQPGNYMFEGQPPLSEIIDKITSP